MKCSNERNDFRSQHFCNVSLHSLVLDRFNSMSFKKRITYISECSVSAWTDLVFLVDGSWSVGRNNFKYILDFIAALVSAFDIGEEKTRVGVVQYSSDTRTEFNLNQYYQQEELLAAIKKIPYKGGNKMTGIFFFFFFFFYKFWYCLR